MKAESPIRCYERGEKLRLGIQRNLPEARIYIESGEVSRIAQLGQTVIHWDEIHA